MHVLDLGLQLAAIVLADLLTSRPIDAAKSFRAKGISPPACFTPFFTAAEREQAGCQHRLFFAQTDLPRF